MPWKLYKLKVTRSFLFLLHSLLFWTFFGHSSIWSLPFEMYAAKSRYSFQYCLLFWSTSHSGLLYFGPTHTDTHDIPTPIQWNIHILNWQLCANETRNELIIYHKTQLLCVHCFDSGKFSNIRNRHAYLSSGVALVGVHLRVWATERIMVTLEHYHWANAWHRSPVFTQLFHFPILHV